MCYSKHCGFIFILIGLSFNIEASEEKSLFEFVAAFKKVFFHKNVTKKHKKNESNDGVSDCIEYSRLSHGEFESYCDEIAEGETIRVDIGYKESMSNVEQKYLLTRNSENSYEIGFNLMFFKEDRFKSLYTSRELRHEWVQKVKDCFSQAGEITVGNGKKLKFSFNKDAPLVPIGKSIFKGHRSNSRKYNPGIKCPTIIHEALHLAGLVDEYHEKKYIHRRLSSPSNIMNNHRWSIEDKHGYYILKNCLKAVNVNKNGDDITYLNEEKERILKLKKHRIGDAIKVSGQNESAKRRLKEIKDQLFNSKKICHQFGEVEIKVNLFEGDYEPNEHFPLSEQSLSWYPTNNEEWYVAKKVVLGGQKALLREDQLNVVLYPGCSDINFQYYECSKYAYEKDPSKVAPEHCLEKNNENRKIFSERIDRFHKESKQRKAKIRCNTDNELALWWYNCDDV